MKLIKILNYIEENLRISKTLINPNYDTEYLPASIKNIIKNGLYFIVGEQLDFIELIDNSLILTDNKNNTFKEGNCYLIVENPQLVHYIISSLFVKKHTHFIHETAIIHPKAEIGFNVNIGAYCVIGKVVIEDDVYLENHVTIKDNVKISKHVYIDSNSCIGAAGIAWIWDDDGKRVLQPQLGGVNVDEKCHIGTDVTIVRGSLSEKTNIGKETVIAHGTKIGHGVQIGAYVHMANNVSLAGNAVIGERSFLGSASVVSSNIKIANNSIIGAGAVVNKNVLDEYCTLVGVPAKIIKKNNFLNKPKGAPKPFKNS